MRKIELNNGEYTVINELGHGGGLRALRYGKEWRNLAGDNLVLALFIKIEDLTEEGRQLRSLLARLRCEECGDELGNNWDHSTANIICGYCNQFNGGD